MSERLDRFVSLMKGIFELDKSDLDFGIYRIMNIRKQEIEKFLSEGLPQKVQETLAPFARNTGEIEKRLAEIEQSLGTDISQLPDTIPMVREYKDLKSQLAAGVDMAALETDVYSALYSFFNRYYDEGDFISKRRYKEGVYAIPYEGEEVKLYWANQDQYYIKTAENFKDYSFVARNPYGDSCTVHFLLVDATTEQNNNKESKDSKRTFMLYQETEEQPELKTFEYRPDTNEFIVRFVFDVPDDKKAKYLELNGAAIRKKIAADYPQLVQILLADVSADKKKPKTLIDKHLEAYVAKNTFDYFIHKDLKGFLYRELDFYIKSEIIHLDDLDTTNEQRVETYLAKVKAIKRVGHIIIDFLAQIEDFQKKLWLKKKFVVETNWCMTLDRIDESFWPEIIANPAQIQEWIEMYAIDEVEGDLTTIGWTNPPTMEFLRQNQNLVVDTKHFSTSFKDRLVASIDDLDARIDGLMINADNSQAIRLIQKRFSEKIKCVYLDPPYNTNDETFIYKNNYKHSSWASMMADKIIHAFAALDQDGVLMVTIDDEELYDLKEIIDACVGADHYIGTIVIQSNPRGRGINSFYATCHEYCLCYAKDPDYVRIIDQELTDEQAKAYSSSDGDVAFRALPFRRSGGWSTPQDRPNSEFPLYFDKTGKLFAVGGERITDASDLYETNTILMRENNETIKLSPEVFSAKFPEAYKIMPVDTAGLRRVWRWSDREKILSAGARNEFILKKENGKSYVQLKDWIKSGRKPKTIWFDSKYDSSSHGTNLLKNLFGERNVFGFPKSVYSTEESLHSIMGEDENSIVVDMFGGSATTGHALINLNRKDNKTRKYILIEMGEYFEQVTKPRLKKVIYSPTWSSGNPVVRQKGISHIMKYFSLESYEDALSNVRLSDEHKSLYNLFGEDYLIHYMLDIESKGSLLDLEQFKAPFSYQMKITERNETKTRRIDLVETFNYLIGISVARQSTVSYFRSEPDTAGGYEGAVRLVKDNDGVYGFKQVEGILPDGRRALVIWRTVAEDLLASNAALDAYFTKHRINPQDREFDVIFVNGDNNLENLRTGEESWKVQMTETEFKNRMFEEV